jgi:hypothetical protein
MSAGIAPALPQFVGNESWWRMPSQGAGVLLPGPILDCQRGVNYDLHVLVFFTCVQVRLACGVRDFPHEFAGFLAS